MTNTKKPKPQTPKSMTLTITTQGAVPLGQASMTSLQSKSEKGDK